MQSDAEFQDELTTEPYHGPIAALGGYRVADDDDDDPVLLNACLLYTSDAADE